MPTSSWLVGSQVGLANQAIDVWSIPTGDLVLLAGPGLSESYPGTGAAITNIAPAGSSEVGTVGSGASYSGGFFDTDGVGEGVHFDDAAWIQDPLAGTGTIIVWFRYTSGVAATDRIVDKDGGGANGGFACYYQSATDFRFFFRTTGTVPTYIATVSTSADTWVCFAFEYDTTTLSGAKAWQDGSPVTVSSASPTGAYISDDGTNLHFLDRAVDNALAMPGKLGMVAVYNRALSDAEHLAFYNATKGQHGGTIDNEETLTFSYDGTYLYHPTAGLSMLATLESALTTGGVTDADVLLAEDGKVRITSTGPCGITWGTATALRDALGFTGDLDPATSHTATNYSPLLWVPRRNESPGRAPLGVSGEATHNISQVVAPDGTQVTREFGSPVRRNDYTWHYIDKDEYWTSAEANGELFVFLKDVGIPGAKFYLYRQVEADEATTTEVTLGTGLGPYELTNGLRSLRMVRAAGFERTDCRFDWTAEVIKTPEYGT